MKRSTKTSSEIDAIINHAEQQCKNDGVRLTLKRKHVLAVLVKSDKALSAYELVDGCKVQFDENIPAMSVYRILEVLEKEHLVHKLSSVNKYVACVHISCDHTHGAPQFLICGNCSKVQEVTINASIMSDLETTVHSAEFKMISPQLEIPCICNDCANYAA